MPHMKTEKIVASGWSLVTSHWPLLFLDLLCVLNYDEAMKSQAKNVLGGQLEACCKFPMTGFYRDGYCHTGVEDVGRHVVCIEATEEFLSFSKKAGNDLSTPHPEMDFPGLIAGDCWCLCAVRWLEAYQAGAAPKVNLAATNEAALEIIPLEALKQYALDEQKFDPLG